MGNYVFDTEFLFEQLRVDSENMGSQRDFGKDIIPSIIADHPVYAYPFEQSGGDNAYWRDVGTIDSFWEANMEMVAPVPQLNLYDRKWPIWTYQEQLPPAKFVWEDHDRRGEAINSVVSGAVLFQAQRFARLFVFLTYVCILTV